MFPNTKKNWPPFPSEFDLDALIPDSIRSEVLEPVNLRIRTLPSCLSRDFESPRSDTSLIFGSPSSAFAPSPAQIRSLSSIFDGHLSSSLSLVGNYPRSETSSERAWEERERSELAALTAQQSGLSLLIDTPPPPPEDNRNALSCSRPCGRCGSRHVFNRENGGTECRHCGLLIKEPSSPSTKTNPKSPSGQQRGGKKRSALIQDFKRQGGRGYHLSDLWGSMLFLSKDQVGSRFLQKELPSASSNEQERYLHEVYDQALAISGDVFGNFIIQVLLETHNSKITDKLVQILKPQMLELSTRPYGCRVVQKAIESLSYDQKLYLIESLHEHVELCALNEHGNHVLQRCLQYLKPEDNLFIYKAVAERTRSLSKDKFACRVVQKAIEEHYPMDYAEPIREHIVRHAVEFAFDESANFVVQKLLRHGTAERIETIVDSFMPHLVKLTCQKVSSNVVETALEVSTPLTTQRMKRKILGADLSDNTVQIASIIRDRFGRYVIEKLLKYCSETEKTKIKEIASGINEAAKYDPKQRSLAKRVQRLLDAF